MMHVQYLCVYIYVVHFEHIISTKSIFTARCYASAVLAMGLCLSVCHKPVFY